MCPSKQIGESELYEAIDAIMDRTSFFERIVKIVVFPDYRLDFIFRDGEIVTVPSDELVCGDVIILEAGDSIPADGRIIEEGAPCELLALGGVFAKAAAMQAAMGEEAGA